MSFGFSNINPPLKAGAAYKDGSGMGGGGMYFQQQNKKRKDQLDDDIFQRKEDNNICRLLKNVRRWIRTIGTRISRCSGELFLRSEKRNLRNLSAWFPVAGGERPVIEVGFLLRDFEAGDRGECCFQ